MANELRRPSGLFELIGKPYELEAQAKRDDVDANELARRRQQDSVLVLAGIEALSC